MSAEKKLLLDVLEMLTTVSDFVEGQVDADHDGEDFVPNRAMRLQTALEGNEYQAGLIARVSAAVEACK